MSYEIRLQLQVSEVFEYVDMIFVEVEFSLLDSCKKYIVSTCEIVKYGALQ